MQEILKGCSNRRQQSPSVPLLNGLDLGVLTVLQGTAVKLVRKDSCQNFSFLPVRSIGALRLKLPDASRGNQRPTRGEEARTTSDEIRNTWFVC